MTNQRTTDPVARAIRGGLMMLIGFAVAAMTTIGSQPAGAAALIDDGPVVGTARMAAQAPEVDQDDSDEQDQVETEEMIEEDRRRRDAWWAQIAELLAQAPNDSGAFPVSPPANLITGKPLSASENWELLSQDQLRLILENPQLGYLLATGDFFDTRPEDDFAPGEAFLTVIETNRASEDCTAGQVSELDLMISIDGEPPVISPELESYPLNGATKIAALACIDGTTDLQLFDAGPDGSLVPDTSGHVRVHSWPMADAPNPLRAAGASDDSHFDVFLTDPDVTSQQPWNGWVASGTENQLDPSTFWVSSYEGLGAGTIDADLTATDQVADDGEGQQGGAAAGADTKTTSNQDDSSDDGFLLLVILVIVVPAFSIGGYIYWNRHRPSAYDPTPDQSEQPEGKALLGDGGSDDGFLS
jgi:hypothetical protein